MGVMTALPKWGGLLLLISQTADFLVTGDFDPRVIGVGGALLTAAGFLEGRPEPIIPTRDLREVERSVR